MKETLILVEEIRYRFRNLDVLPEVLNSKVPYDENGISILKTVIIGAFYRKYIHCEYRNQHERIKYMNPGIITPNFSERSVIYNKIPDYIKETHIEMLVNKCIDEKVEKVLIMYEKPIVILEKILETPQLLSVLKKCFRIHKRISIRNRSGFGDLRTGRIEDQYNEMGLSGLDKSRSLQKKKGNMLNKLRDIDDSSEDELDGDITKEYEIDDETAIRLLEESDLKQPIHLDGTQIINF